MATNELRCVNTVESLQASLGATYTLERELGGGGMSRVFLAREVALDRAVVIKVLPAELVAGVSVARFAREIALAARLQHPHIVPLLGAGHAGDTPWFSMPFVEGQSLRAVLAKGELPIPQTVRILRDIASALAYAHERGVVHRDIKPDNVLLSDGVAVVTDFGVAKAVADSSSTLNDATVETTGLTSIGMAMGTLAYMPPEQIAGDPHVDHRADIYAFGMVAYELLAGRHPFSGRNAQAVIAAQMTEVPVSIAQVRSNTPSALAELVSACVAKSPADRPQSAREIVQRLDVVPLTSGETRTASGSVTRATNSSDAMTATTRGTRRMSVMALAATLVALAIGGVVLWKRSATPTSTGASTTNISQIAVLPFENIGGDTANAYFADGMTDELANALAKVPALTIASRTSSYAYRDASRRDLQVIRDALGVGAILEGTVTRAADKLRVSARLTRTADRVEIWSDAFVRPANDVFAVQNELGKAIVTALTPSIGARKAIVSADTSRGTNDPVAYDLYLRARHAWELRGLDNIRQSVVLFEEAARKDSNFARAHAGVALAKTLLADNVPQPESTIMDEIERSAFRAIALDSSLSEPHQALGFAYGNTGRFARAIAEFTRAIALDPRAPTAHLWFGVVLRRLGRPDEVLRETARAAQLDPLSGIVIANYANSLRTAGRRDEAFASMRRALELMPAYAGVRREAAWMHSGFNQSQVALAQLDTGAQLSGFSLGLWRPEIRVAALLQLGDTASARAFLSRRDIVEASQGVHGPQIADAFAALGDRDRALSALLSAWNWGLSSAAVYEADPTWAPFRNDLRFKRMMQVLRERDR